MKNTKIGDVFSILINESEKRYFQYIISDLTQLNSDVIRVFKKSYFISQYVSLSEIVTDEVEFYAHCITKLGIKSGCWERIGNVADVGETGNVLFRDSGDYGNSHVKVSNDWWIWKINEKQVRVGKLEEKYQNAEIGIVINPKSIVHRIKTGKYDFFYPDYE